MRLLEPLAWLSIQQSIQLAALTELHHEVQVTVCLNSAVAGGQEGVVDLCQDVFLREHTLHLISLLHLPLVKSLHSKLQISTLQDSGASIPLA